MAPLTTVATFSATNGSLTTAGLIEDAAGDLFGTIGPFFGGQNIDGCRKPLWRDKV